MSFTNLTVPQNEFLVSYLRGTGRVLTSRQADALYGIRNLRARISELRQEGYQVRTQKNTVGTTNYAVSRRMINQ
jgi:Helix-turn-helix domain